MTFGVIGGDRRQAVLSRLFAEDGHTVISYGLCGFGITCGAFEEAAAADCVVLPLPLCKQENFLNCECCCLKTADLFAYFQPEQCLLAGQIHPRQKEEANAQNLLLMDYYAREELAVANAAATAEAAIQVAMERMETALLGMEILVLGFGRIGRLLCHRLTGLGARVHVAARSPSDRAWACAYGWLPLQIRQLSGQVGQFGVVFNTVPAMVVDDFLLEQLPPDCLCIDLASTQGIDHAAAERLQVKTVWARQLPGRLLPCSAAAAIRNTIYNIMDERGAVL